jgi:hypothetical protein
VFGDSYLIDYLLTTTMPAAQIDELGEAGSLAVQLAHELCIDFGYTQPHYMELESYYIGEPPLPRDPERLVDEYKPLLLMGRSDWCALVVDVVNERLRIGSVGSTKEPNQDPTMWDWWARNNMDGVASQVHTTALKFGVCFVSVWPTVGGKNDGLPKIMGESPLSACVRIDPETGEVTAAIRLWCGTDGLIYCDLTTATAQWRLVSKGVPQKTYAVRNRWVLGHRNLLTLDPSTVEWTFRDPADTPPVRLNPLGKVGYVPMYTQPDLLGGCHSEMATILPIQDRINKTCFDRLVTQEFCAFPQRAIAGVDDWRDPETGEVKLPFDAAQDRVWTATSPDTKFTQFESDAGKAYLDATTADIQALATQSRTPPHYLLAGMGVFPSGESVRATEWGLTRKVQMRQQSYGDAWADVLRLCAIAARNDVLADDPGVRVNWDDVEARSEGEVVDALLKMGTLGVPWDALWKRWGATPEEMKDWSDRLNESIRRAQQFAALATVPGAAGQSSSSDKSNPGDLLETSPPPKTGSNPFAKPSPFGDVDRNPATPA